ncbi:ribonuclease P protein component [Plantactinospora sp. WMMB334]|uniref:ribonuclease P protein component n=1 Tax=Plantactinospora sp. WMMB334 TaxID=3404119 RepID=UPI003B9268C2
MLAAAQRLRRSSDFAAAIRGGRRANRGSVVVHLDPAAVPVSPMTETTPKPAPDAGARQEPAPARAGFVVSKAVGGAVVRNRVRRRLRHLVRDRLPGLPPGTTIVVRALPAAAGASYAALGADLDAAIAASQAPRKPSRRHR